MFLYFGKLWDVVFWVLSFLLFIYKGVNLPYPDGAYELEFAYLFLYLLVEPPRLFLGSKGNKTLTAGPLYASSLLGVFVVFMHAYYVFGKWKPPLTGRGVRVHSRYTHTHTHAHAPSHSRRRGDAGFPSIIKTTPKLHLRLSRLPLVCPDTFQKC